MLTRSFQSEPAASARKERPHSQRTPLDSSTKEQDEKMMDRLVYRLSHPSMQEEEGGREAGLFVSPNLPLLLLLLGTAAASETTAVTIDRPNNDAACLDILTCLQQQHTRALVFFDRLLLLFLLLHLCRLVLLLRRLLVVFFFSLPSFRCRVCRLVVVVVVVVTPDQHPCVCVCVCLLKCVQKRNHSRVFFALIGPSLSSM